MTERGRNYEQICDASPDAIVLVDGEGEITYANDRIREMLGYDPDALVGDPIEVLVPERYREDHVAMRDGYMEDPEARPMGADLELHARRADGTEVPVDIGLSPIRGDEGLEYMAVVRDVRDRVALQRKYRSILEAVPDAVVIADAASGEIVEANSQVTELLGSPPEELIGQDQAVLHPEGERPRYRELFERAVAEGSAMFTEFPDGSAVHVERSDGERVPVEINAQIFEMDGRPSVAGVFRDVSARRERERQLRELTRTTRRLLDAEDADDVARLVTDAARSILGYESTVVRLLEDDRSLQAVAVTEDARSEMGCRPEYTLGDDSPVSRAFETGDPLAFDDVRRVEDGYDRGSARAAMYHPIGDHGVLSVVDTETEAFDQSAMELASILAANAETALDRLAYEAELERQNDRLEDFAGVVSHDLRNPLSVARGWVEIVNADDSEAIGRVEDALDRMDAIIEDTLTLARQGRTVADSEVIDVATVAGGCWRVVATEGGHLDVADEFRIRGDRDRVQHVLENLFRNAVEHGGPDVTVSIGRLEQGFYVEDDGPGIPPEDREAVFEAGHTSRPDGTGFGLTIVRDIAEAHGWTVRVTESESGGARFEFTNVDLV